MSFCFIGIDQTGALDRHGNPKPLATCLIFGTELHFFYLKNFSKKLILDQIQQLTGLKTSLKLNPEITRQKRNAPFIFNSNRDPVLICLDCVIGLPRQLHFEWRDVVKKTIQQPGFGREAAQAFFADLYDDWRMYFSQNQTTFPRRESEILLKANSVFQTHPFQKNIQTGTFRFWKEMAHSPEDFYAPAIENRPQRASTEQPIPIFEGYPSHSWLKLFSSKKRDPKKLTALMRKRFPKLNWKKSHQYRVNQDTNLADALLLALTLHELVSCKGVPSLSITPLEGFILSEILPD